MRFHDLQNEWEVLSNCSPCMSSFPELNFFGVSSTTFTKSCFRACRGCFKSWKALCLLSTAAQLRCSKAIWKHHHKTMFYNNLTIAPVKRSETQWFCIFVLRNEICHHGDCKALSPEWLDFRALCSDWHKYCAGETHCWLSCSAKYNSHLAGAGSGPRKERS